MTGADAIWAALTIPLLALTRATFIVILLPILGARSTPAMVRMGLILTIALVLLRHAQFQPETDMLGTAFCTEVIYGATIGIVARLLWELMLLPLALMDISLGRGSMGGPPIVGNESEGPLTTLGGLAFLAIYASIAAHLDSLRGLIRFPTWSTGSLGLAEFSHSFQAIFELAVSIAMPALLVALLVDLALGWANRTLPSLPAMFIAMPLRSLIGWTLVPTVILASAWSLRERGADWLSSMLGM